jgi:acetolactate synthase-1/2/3 large subunit
VACTLLGLSAFPPDHELYVGMLGMHGNYAVNIQTNECDVLIAVGMRFDDRVTGDLKSYARQAKIIHIDIDASEIGKNVPTDIGLVCDAGEALRELQKACLPKAKTSWLDEFREAEELEFNEVMQEELFPESDGLRMAEVTRMLSEMTGGNAVIVTDVGQHQMVVSRYYKHRSRRGSITSGGLGTMGFALPAAIGAKIAAPEREVIAVIGDGGFQMTIQELGTLAQAKVSLKVVILNNNFLGMVRQWQELFFEKRYSFTPMDNPEFTTIAKAYGIKSGKIVKRLNLESGLKQMLKSKEAFLLEVVVEKEENVFPMVPTGSSVGAMILKDLSREPIPV